MSPNGTTGLNTPLTIGDLYEKIKLTNALLKVPEIPPPQIFAEEPPVLQGVEKDFGDHPLIWEGLDATEINSDLECQLAFIKNNKTEKELIEIFQTYTNPKRKKELVPEERRKITNSLHNLLKIRARSKDVFICLTKSEAERRTLRGNINCYRCELGTLAEKVRNITCGESGLMSLMNDKVRNLFTELQEKADDFTLEQKKKKRRVGWSPELPGSNQQPPTPPPADPQDLKDFDPYNHCIIFTPPFLFDEN